MSKKLSIPPKEELMGLYLKEGETLSSLARHYNTSHPTIRKWLISYGIERKSQLEASKQANRRNRAVIPPKSELSELYKNNSIKGLEQYYNTNQETIYNWLQEHNIKIRSLSESCYLGKKKQFAHLDFDKDFLIEQYDPMKPMGFLAEKLGVSYSFIKHLLKKYEIEVTKTWRSKAEIDLFEYCVNNFPEYNWSHSNKSIINPYELDIVNEDLKIAIEYCGLYWHSEFYGKKDKNYHQIKWNKCLEKGYKLITVFESDDLSKIKSLINTLHNKNKRVYARNTTIREISSSEARVFHDEYHIQKSRGAKIHLGLFNNNELLMVSSFGSSRFSKKHDYECIRMTSHKDYTVVGGASKLFKYFIKNYDPSFLITYADLRFGDGQVYDKCGMKFGGYTKPNYWYFNKNTFKIYSRVKYQKHKLSKLLDDFDSSKTEYQNMLNNKYDRIWDCGNAIYTYKKGGE